MMFSHSCEEEDTSSVKVAAQKTSSMMVTSCTSNVKRISKEKLCAPCNARSWNTFTEVGQHNITHVPLRSWSSMCVRKCKRQTSSTKRSKREGCQRWCSTLASWRGEDAVAIQVAKGRRTRIIFANLAPKKGKTHEFGADAMMVGLERQGYKEMILLFDGEHALKAVQEDVNAKRNYQTIVYNSPVGDSRANGALSKHLKGR